MYLESIFVAGDIRAQLPEEAKKFDNIDKLFKKVRKSHQSSLFSLENNNALRSVLCLDLKSIYE